jgi:ribonuclease P protein component
MPPKAKRLTIKDFSEKKRSAVYKTALLDIRVISNNKNKFACVVKKNITNKAVERNKIRRKVYSALQTVFNGKVYSVIAYPQKQTLLTKKENIIKTLQELIQQHGNL